MLVHPDVHFTSALADHRQILEARRHQARGESQEEFVAERPKPVRNRRRLLRLAQS